MDKNKSIDGLSMRRTKTVSATVKRPAVTKKINIAEKKPTQHIPVKKVVEEEPLPVKHFDEQIAEDFLKPVTAFEFDGESGELKQATEPIKVAPKTKNEKSKKDKKEKKKPSKARTIITSIALAIVLLLIGGIIYVVTWGNDIIAKITGGNGNVWDAITTLLDENYEPLKEDENGRTNILAFGTSGYNMDGDEGNGTHDGAQLTDSIMVISINQKTSDIVMFSIPRDLKAVRTCTATGKINEVYWCNNMNGDDEEAGAEALMDAITTVTGLEFQYYAHVNWESLIDIVDAIGGITVTLDETIEYDYTNYDGSNMVEQIWENSATTLNGRQALGIARARHVTKMGDFSRGNSQQRILIGIKDRIYEANLGFTELLGLVETLGDNLRTNLSIADFKTAIHLTYEFDFDSMRQVPFVDYDEGIYYMTTGMINGISYVLPSAGDGNFAALQNYIADIIANEPVEEEATEAETEEVEE